LRKFVIFDFGGVLIDWNPRHRIGGAAASRYTAFSSADALRRHLAGIGLL
jgi:hypothetical protein